MAKWLGGIAGAVITGVLIFWLTEGMRSPPSTPGPNANDGSTQAGQHYDQPRGQQEHASLTGTWDSHFGTLALQQRGTRVTGTLTYSSEALKGGIAAIEGSLSGRKLSYVWWLPQMGQTQDDSQGDGVLTVAATYDRMEGTLTDKNNPGKTGTWILVRRDE